MNSQVNQVLAEHRWKSMPEISRYHRLSLQKNFNIAELKPPPIAYYISIFNYSRDQTMGFFLDKKCLFSGFSGVLLDKGSPLAHVELYRKVEYRDKLYEDKVITNKEGRFTFKSVWYRPLIDDIDQFSAHQDIFINYKNSEIWIWSAGKLSPHEFAEFGAIPINLVCDISNEMDGPNLTGATVATMCKWEI